MLEWVFCSLSTKGVQQNHESNEEGLSEELQRTKRKDYSQLELSEERGTSIFWEGRKITYKRPPPHPPQNPPKPHPKPGGVVFLGWVCPRPPTAAPHPPKKNPCLVISPERRMETKGPVFAQMGAARQRTRLERQDRKGLANGKRGRSETISAGRKETARKNH